MLCSNPQAMKRNALRPTWLSCQSSEVVAVNNGPLPRLRSLLCLVQRSLPLRAGVVLRAPLREHGIRDLEVAMRCAIERGCVPGTIKLLHCGGLADWAKERPGQRSATFRATLHRVERVSKPIA